MKTTILITAFVTGLVIGTCAQVTGGNAPTPKTPGGPFTPTMPGRIVPQPDGQSIFIPSNNVTFSNQATIVTTNQASTTNGANNLPATGNASGANQINNNQRNGNFVFRDDAVTPNDRILLANMRQNVQMQLGITAPSALPVHFVVNNGEVTLVGIVPSAEEGQRIVQFIQQTPGVTTVMNHLAVGTPPPNAVQPQGSLSVAVADHAFSPRDQSLLAAVRQDAVAQLGNSMTAGVPVHFSIQNGIVGVMGQVSSQEQKQALLAAVQQTPGVVRVVDNLQILNAPGNNLPPTSGRPGGTNTIFLNPTNTTGITP